MKHNKILYILLLIVLVFLIIYKNNIFEGLTTYTYFPNMNKLNDGVLYKTNATYVDCETKCTNDTTCKGFTSDLPINSNAARTGECRVFQNDSDLNKNNLKNLKYQFDSHLYIK